MRNIQNEPGRRCRLLRTARAGSRFFPKRSMKWMRSAARLRTIFVTSMRSGTSPPGRETRPTSADPGRGEGQGAWQVDGADEDWVLRGREGRGGRDEVTAGAKARFIFVGGDAALKGRSSTATPAFDLGFGVAAGAGEVATAVLADAKPLSSFARLDSRGRLSPHVDCRSVSSSLSPGVRWLDRSARILPLVLSPL